MKKLPVIIVCLFYSLCTLEQLPEVMQMTFPKGTKKLDERQLISLSHRRFDEKTVPGFHNHVYEKDRLLIYYLNLSQFPTHPERRHSLEADQKMMVSLLSIGNGNGVDKSKIITVNNIRFAIIEYHDKDNLYIRFTSDYDKNGGLVNGFIEYKKPDDMEAKQYLQDLLQSMHFINN